MGTRFIFPIMVAALTVQAAPIDIPISFVEIWSNNTNSLSIPCPLCGKAMEMFLDFCKEFDGISIPRLQEFVGNCALIGEAELQIQDLAAGCTTQSSVLRSRARIWNRKLKCLKIYTSLSQYNSPFDPCTGILTVVKSAPMAICESQPVMCVLPPAENEYDFPPPWNQNMSLPNEFPPLFCPQYVSSMEAACKQIKSENFYNRSNLDGFCASQYAGFAHQISGCETVRSKMMSQDYMMDLCGSLYAAPINVDFETYCNTTLHLPYTESVPDAGYAAYLQRVLLYKEAWDIQHNPPTSLPIVFPPGDRVINMTAVAVKPKVVIPIEQVQD